MKSPHWVPTTTLIFQNLFFTKTKTPLQWVHFNSINLLQKLLMWGILILWSGYGLLFRFILWRCVCWRYSLTSFLNISFFFQDRVVLLHHPVAKVKRQKLLNTEIKKVRRKLSMDKASQKSQKGKFCIYRFRCCCCFQLNPIKMFMSTFFKIRVLV